MDRMKNDKGFSLIEVMIAVAIFSVFITAFIAGQGFNLFDSMQLKRDIKLMELCQMKFNELVINPPENIQATLTTAVKDTKTFEKFPEYEYTVEFKKFPKLDVSRLSSTGDDEDNEKEENPIKKKIYEQVQKNLEKLIWQMSITVKNKESGAQTQLTGFMYNEKGKVEFSGF